jgi:hypothetical protein
VISVFTEQSHDYSSPPEASSSSPPRLMVGIASLIAIKELHPSAAQLFF